MNIPTILNNIIVIYLTNYKNYNKDACLVNIFKTYSAR